MTSLDPIATSASGQLAPQSDATGSSCWFRAEAALERKIGARGLRMIIEDLMLDIMYTLPGQKKIRECVITREVVLSKEEPITVIEKAG